MSDSLSPRTGLTLPHDADELCRLAVHELDERGGVAGDDDAYTVAMIYTGMAVVVRLGELIEAVQEAGDS